jgi:hypothetical protein
MYQTWRESLSYQPPARLNFAGNGLFPEKGTQFLFFLAGFPNGASWAVKKDAFVANVMRKQMQSGKW